MSPDTMLASDYSSGLRELADFIEANPSLARYFTNQFEVSGILFIYVAADDKRSVLNEFARTALKSNAVITHAETDALCYVNAIFGPIVVRAIAARRDCGHADGRHEWFHSK